MSGNLLKGLVFELLLKKWYENGFLKRQVCVARKAIMQGKLIAIAYTLRTY